MSQPASEPGAQSAMSEEKYTRCPACKTIFRVTTHQLSIRAGQVRCGNCQTVFDGNAQRLPMPQASPPTAHDERYDEAAMGPPTMTLRTPRPAVADAKESPAEVHYEDRFSWARQQRRRRAATVAYAIGAPLLLLVLASQAAFHFRDLVAMRWPATRPALVRMCSALGCAIEPVHDVAGLSIDASDLQADPAHRGLLILSATLRNRSPWPLGYPHLELTLTDAHDQTVARRALQPSEYAGGTADLANGIPANADVPVKLFIDASATSQAGYRLYLFYP